MIQIPGEIFLVGGAIRDRLLGRTGSDRDYVVVGSTPEAMRAAGFKQVGQEFPVFLHPETGDEYALARTERKQGKGYRGFVCDFKPTVTLKEDLQRRDLTVNAIAEDAEGHLIDPFNGLDDLKNRKLRHVSPAFVEDPLRVLRLARFQAELFDYQFHIVEETVVLGRQISASGELSALTVERVALETIKALETFHPEEYFYTLAKLHALDLLFPELSPSWQSIDLHQQPGIKTLQRAVELNLNTQQRWAAFIHDQSQETIIKLSERLKLSKALTQLSLKVNQLGPAIIDVPHSSAEEIESLLRQLNAYRNPNTLKQAAAVMAAIEDNKNLEHYAPLTILVNALEAALNINNQELIKEDLSGKALGEAIKTARIEAIQAIIN